jgi:hypothetical protein
LNDNRLPALDGSIQRAPPSTDVEKLDEIFVFLSGELYAEDQAAEAINFTNTIFAAPAPVAGGLN